MENRALPYCIMPTNKSRKNDGVRKNHYLAPFRAISDSGKIHQWMLKIMKVS